jgi:hypothetical protein
MTDSAYIPERPRSRADIERIFGVLKYEVNEIGALRITNDFATNLVLVPLPIVKHRTIHKLIVERVTSALTKIERAGKAEEIRTFGTFALRKSRTSDLLSFHAFGIAIDINARENQMCALECKLDPVIIDAFKSEGFSHGWDWHTIKDPMHFEYYERITTTKG